MLTEGQISEIRTIARMEALRASVFSVAAESLDAEGQAVELAVYCRAEGDQLAAHFEFHDRTGSVVAGGSL